MKLTMEKQQISNYQKEMFRFTEPKMYNTTKYFKMKFKNHYNAMPSEGEKNFEPSQTIPDQTMPIIEILRRHAQGLPIEGTRVPIYEGEDNDLPDFKTLDLAEVEALRYRYEAELQAIKSDISEKERKQKEKQASEAREAKNKSKEVITDAEVIDDEEPQPKTKPKKEPKAGS